MRIAIAADHNGIRLKAHLVDWIAARGHQSIDLGAHAERVIDYPALCVSVCQQVQAASATFGVVIGGSGQGELIACNKVVGIRAGLAYSRFAVEISRGNNDANVMVLGAKTISADRAEELLSLWLSTPFKGGVHQRRVDQITALETLR